ncbi:MAG: SprT family protein [Thermoactinomyces sp.]
MTKWTDKELQTRVEALSLQHFGIPFRHLARFNPRLRTTGGRYCLESHAIEMNPRYLEECGEDLFQKMILHELCHYHLHLQGKGYRHRDADFKYWLQRVGGLRYAPALKPEKRKQPKYVLTCTVCEKVYYRQRRVDLQKYRCGICRGKLMISKANPI